MKSRVLWLLLVIVLLAPGCAAPGLTGSGASDVPIIKAWSGDFPVAQIDRLPQGQRDSAVGYLSNTASFERVWAAIKPDEPLPSVEFDEQLVVFVRNTQFYNRMSIAKVTLENGVAEVLAMETMSALPIEDQVSMAMAVVPRAGILYIQAGGQRIAVSAQ